VRYCGLGLTERGQRSIRDFEVVLSDELTMPNVEANESDQDGRKRQKKDRHTGVHYGFPLADQRATNLRFWGEPHVAHAAGGSYGYPMVGSERFAKVVG
jgi:hypothetical protein